MFGLDLKTILFRVVILVIAFTVHEFMHAFVANKFGDLTPKNAGRLTLNPLVHLDPIGSIMLLLAGFGWAKPVPVNPNVIRQKNPAGLMLVSLAGPMSNLVMAAIAGGLLRLFVAIKASWLPFWIVEFIFQCVIVNISLFLFNMIPFAPLDGEKVLEYTLPSSWQNAFQTLRRYGPYILLGAIMIGRFSNFSLFGFLLDEPMGKIFQFLTGLPLE